MKLECDKEKIERVLQKVSRLASKHLTLPVLACVYLEASTQTNVLKIKATNLDVGVEVELKVVVKQAGSVAVPANILLNSISVIKDKQINLELIEGNLKVSATKNSALIKSMPHEDFPSIPKLNQENNNDLKTIKIAIKDLLMGFKSVWYSASNSNIKPELGSVFVYKGDNGLVFVSTDSFRLAEKVIVAKTNNNDFPQVLIPYKNVSEIIKIFDDDQGGIEIIFDKNQAAFITKEFYLVSRLIDGSFPDYKQIIPKEFVSTVTILKNDFLNSIKNSNIFSDTLNQVKLKLDVKDGLLYIESKNNDIGEYQESTKVIITGKDLELNFNNRYITECMQSINSDSLTLSFGGQGKPLLINGLSDKSFSYIVMPMNR